MDGKAKNSYFFARSALQKLLIRDIFCILQVVGGNMEKVEVAPFFYFIRWEKLFFLRQVLLNRLIDSILS